MTSRNTRKWQKLLLVIKSKTKFSVRLSVLLCYFYKQKTKQKNVFPGHQGFEGILVRKLLSNPTHSC